MSGAIFYFVRERVTHMKCMVTFNVIFYLFIFLISMREMWSYEP